MSDSYFLYHSIGMYPRKSDDLANAITEFASVWGHLDDNQWAYALGGRQKFIDRWRQILKAPEHTLTTSESVTAAFHSVLTAVPPEHLKGRTVLIGADCFPSNHFLLSGMAEKYGFTLETVPLRQGAGYVEDEDLIAAWTPQVGLCLLTWISSTSSHRIDLEKVVAHGRKMGSLIGVDITQGAGLLPFDVMAPEVDFCISTSLKWMCGTPGAGVLYLSPQILPQCKPELRGWFSQPNPFNWDITKFEYAPDIRRFDSGTPSIMASLATLPALEWHAQQDQVTLLAHNRMLTAKLIEAVDEMGLVMITPRGACKRGGSIMVELPQTHPAATIVAGLRAKGITTDARGQRLRMSPGNMTSMAGTERLIATLGKMIATKGV
jgi:selenocysteine lyase/cysteine desulfurase